MGLVPGEKKFAVLEFERSFVAGLKVRGLPVARGKDQLALGGEGGRSMAAILRVLLRGASFRYERSARSASMKRRFWSIVPTDTRIHSGIR